MGNNTATHSNYFNYKLDFFFKSKANALISSRVESTNWYKNTNLVYLILNNIIPKDKKVKDKCTLNIYFLDFIGTYKGWRHSTGLPVRGQRTWTNSKTTKLSNTNLRKFKFRLAKKIYGNTSVGDINVGYLAEQVNSFWKNQWESEWARAKRKRLTTLKKSKGIYKIDLKTMASGEVRTKKKKSKKKKDNASKNSFVLGFDPGFTKLLLKTAAKKEMITLKKYSK